MNEKPLLSPRWESAKEICHRLGICRTTWWRWSYHADCPKPSGRGRVLRWNSAEVDAFFSHKGE